MEKAESSIQAGDAERMAQRMMEQKVDRLGRPRKKSRDTLGNPGLPWKSQSWSCRGAGDILSLMEKEKGNTQAGHAERDGSFRRQEA